MEGILHILKNVHVHITEDDEEKLVDSIFNLVYPQWVYEEIPKLEIEYQKLIWHLMKEILINNNDLKS